MSRPNDAFFSLINDVPGVDTSCFVKRTLNDLKPKTPNAGHLASEAKVESSVPATKVETEAPLVYEFGSLDLDSLGTKTQDTQTKQPSTTVQFEDLFDGIPGCEETLTTPPQQTIIQEEAEVLPTFPTQTEHEKEDVVDMELKGVGKWTEETVGLQASSEDHSQNVDVVSEEDSEEPEWKWTEDEKDVEPGGMMTPEESPTEKKSKFKFEKYRNQFNKQAASLRKIGMRAVKQGLGAAQEWMDKKVEERKQSNAASSKSKQDDREAKKFLEDLELLSHDRREILLAKIPPEFLHKVMEYVERKGISVDHLFITTHELEGTEKIEQTNQEELTKDEQEKMPKIETQDDEEGQEAEVDILGVSEENEATSSNFMTQQEVENIVDPDDLDSFFACGNQSTNDPHISGNTDFNPADFCQQDGNLMAFDNEGKDVGKSDYKAMYEQLKRGGQHTEEQIRMILRQKRIEEKESKMQKALEAKIERDRDDEENRELLHKLKEQHLQMVVEWKERHANNMRGLLTTLHTVLWEDSGWKLLSVGDVLEPIQVKKAYMKANLIIHPDKVKQKGGSAEQVVLADMVFNVLKEAWKEFKC